MKMRVADYIASTLVEHGITDVYMVTGGGAMHLNDAFGKADNMRVICCHHEQSCSIAAESYCRVSGNLAAVNVTTGPGGINALNGVHGAYTDSIGMLIVSGQVKRETFAGNYDLPLRQLGDQEVDIVSMVRSITKYATVLRNPQDVRQVLEKAIWLARTGRPGPVWIDVPIDVQGALVEVDELKGFVFDAKILVLDMDVARNSLMDLEVLSGPELTKIVSTVYASLKAARRPLIMLGSGVRISRTLNLILELINRLGIPVVTAWNAHDLIPDDHPCYAGRPGTVGNRAGNFAVQNADFVLVLGNRLNIRQISYNWTSFAKNAQLCVVDIDSSELSKPTLKIDLPVHARLENFIPELLSLLHENELQPEHEAYRLWCRERVRKYPVTLPEYYHKTSPVNPYVFVEQLFLKLEEGEIIVSANGTACVTTFQAAIIKNKQRLYTNSGAASMGYDLPAAIGAWYATGAKRIICLAGDGSIMMNLQELQVIAGAGLPIKIFVLNNNGYHSIRQTQNAFFPGNVVGCGPESGLTFPDFTKLATAFGITSCVISCHDALAGTIQRVLDAPGPQLCEVFLDPDQTFSPKLSSRRLDDGRMISSELEDMFPFLSREELAENMLTGQ